jgi:type 1 glutamine amidotransferase
VANVLIIWGGWEGHEPEAVARLFEDMLLAEGFAVDVSDSLDAFADASAYDLIVPIVTMGTITDEQLRPVLSAVEAGVGLAGCHGGMCDAFRECTEWQFMTGGQWVAHPGDDGVTYRVEVRDKEHEITRGIDDFDVSSEQYYMHVDPAVHVLATTRFPVADGPHAGNGKVDMPVAWTKMWGKGRVFYCSLGHKREVLEAAPVRELMRRGFLWSARTQKSPTG